MMFETPTAHADRRLRSESLSPRALVCRSQETTVLLVGTLRLQSELGNTVMFWSFAYKEEPIGAVPTAHVQRFA